MTCIKKWPKRRADAYGVRRGCVYVRGESIHRKKMMGEKNVGNIIFSNKNHRPPPTTFYEKREKRTDVYGVILVVS